MIFNSIDFAIFLPIVFILYWFVFQKNIRIQNILIVIASYTFYGWWDWRFLGLILFSTIVDYTIGLLLKKQEDNNKRKYLLYTSIFINLGLLGFFKYYNFFVSNFVEAFTFLGTKPNIDTLNIILPIGISFYTFQTLSYTIDVYKRKLEPTNDFIAFSAFVTFFPQLVAGPIERAVDLLPQFYKKRTFDYSKAVDGLRQVLWGLFKKIVIADNCAEYANIIFNNHTEHSGLMLILGALFFAFQIYGDFSGYSDIAIGTSRLFGFNLMQNFAFPYFSRDIAEFWRRWHISLNTWFRDYIYIPLGGSRGGNFMKIRNTFIIFIISGFWHGANWTFIFWGLINAFYFLPLLINNRNRVNMGTVAEGKKLPNRKEVLQILSTFVITIFAWIFFRAENISHAFSYISRIFSSSILSSSNFKALPNIQTTSILLIIFIIIEWIGREQQYAIQKLGLKWKSSLRYLMYFILILSLFFFGGEEQQFIYFQF